MTQHTLGKMAALSGVHQGTQLWMKTSVVLSLVLVLGAHVAHAKEIKISLAGDGCDNPQGYYIGDDDIAVIYHSSTYNAIATRDDCYVTLRSDQGRRLEYAIEDARFQQCGITITLYDSPSTDSNPRQVLSCSSGNAGLVIDKTNFNVMRLHLRKSNVNTDNFQFQMKVINDRGKGIREMIDHGKADDAERDALEPGVIVGIAIAGVIIIIALVLLAIYLCIRARQDYAKDGGHSSHHEEANVYTSGNSQHLFANKKYPKRPYGSTEDVRSTTSSQEKTNGAYANQAYSANAVEKKSNRSNSLGRSRGKTGFANESFQQDDMDVRHGNHRSWEEGDEYEVRIGSFRKSRIDSFKSDKKMKSAMKKPSEIEMSKVNTQPNSILKKSRPRSPNRSQTSSTEGSLDANAIIHGYNRSTIDHPNVQHKPVLERRRSRSGTRSHRSASSGGYSGSRRAHSADRKPKPTPKNTGRMYGDVFIDDRDKRARSSSRNRARSTSTKGSRSHRGSDSVDSESSVASSRRVNMNPGGKRVHIKGEETDI